MIEDEAKLCELLVRLLREAGYAAVGAATAGEGITLALSDDVDLVLLDLNLPDIAGEDVLRAITSAKPETRVVVLSATTAVGRRISVLEAGAVDFLLKPFITAELLLRIKLRLPGYRAESGAAADRLPVVENVVLDTHRRELVVGTSRVSLSQREFTLLTHLIERRGNTCSRQELLADVWGMEFDPGTNVVDVCVRRLRAKFMTDAIETVRNVGYRLVAS
ncbi:MAG TPA: response regulator transcription factor [Jatrophihabitans sp.]|uniref:response regulator transcription factor n=1 Tax=Jatrophihabitans sp. TaxID=1932789 RepID=UPI002DF84E59|nr:response regulator transcription factor [Jatrophihabitans sp.]